MPMKLSLLKRNTRSLLKANQSLRTNVPYKKAITVGLIFSVEDKQKHDLIKDFIKKLELDEKKVTVMSFLPKKKENYEFLFDFFSDNDLSFWGKITSSSAASFAETPFDFLFYIDTEPNVFILNLIARSKAKCRVGKYYGEEDNSYFELMIENQGNTKSLIDGMYKYASVLR